MYIGKKRGGGERRGDDKGLRGREEGVIGSGSRGPRETM